MSTVFSPGNPLEEYAEGLGFMLTFANVTAVDTDEGLVLIDCGDMAHSQGIYVRKLEDTKHAMI